MKIIVTGADGFVGKYLVEQLKKTKGNVVIGLDRNQADITNFKSVKKFIVKHQPDQIYHLAGFASGAGKDKELIFKVNVDGTLNILKSLKDLKKPVKVLLASTAYVYGNTPKCANEKTEPSAMSLYDKSKLEMEKKSSKYGNKNIDIIITRASNHIGPYQKPGFVVPDFCLQIAKAKQNSIITVGNLDAQRDIFDVRDCVKAYELIMNKGKSGQIYNIGTGKTITIKEILNKIIKISKKKITFEYDPDKMRPSDISKNCVNNSKLMKLGWKPKISLDKSLKDTYMSYLTKKKM